MIAVLTCLSAFLTPSTVKVTGRTFCQRALRVKDSAFIAFTLVVSVGPAEVWAQDEQPSNGFYGFAVGTHHLWEVNGFTVQASVGRWRWPKPRPGGLGVRLDAFAEQFEARVASRFETMGVAGVTASVLRATKTLHYHWMLGPSINYFYRHPSRRGAVRPGFSAGFAFVSASRHPSGIRLSLEARLHGIPGPRTRHFVLPVSLGILF